MATKDRRLRVLHLSGSHAFYGAEQAILTLATHMDLARCSPIVGCLLDEGGPSSRMLEEARARGIRTFEVRVRGRVDLRGVRALRRFLAEEQVQVLHCHGYKADAYGWLAARGLPALRVATAHGWTGETRAVRAYEWIDKRVFLGGYYRVIVVSEALREQLLLLGFCRAKLAYIPNGIDVSRFEMRTERSSGLLPFMPEDEVIGSVGRLSPEKGHSYLLDAMPRVLEQRPRARLVLVGDGREETRLREKIQALGLGDKVLLAGVREDVPRLLAEFDVFALPSVTEGLPVSVLEAMAVGVPVVATSVGDVPMVVRHDETGLLVSARDSGSLAAAILRSLVNRQASQKMARAGRALVEQEYSARAIAERTLALYEEALPSAGTGGDKA